MPDAYIFDAIRTPRGKGKADGALYPVRPQDLLSGVLSNLQERCELDTSQVEDVVIGCVTQAGEQGSCIARTAALHAGYDQNAAGVTLNRFCASGLEAVNHAAAMVASGYHDMVVAGGVESMSRVQMGSDGGAFFEPRYQWRVGSIPQGISADLLATMHGYQRQDVDAFAYRSQMKAISAQESGAFDRSIVPVRDEVGLPYLEVDEHPRRDTTIAALGKLKPSFAMMGEQFALDALAKQRYPHIERIDHIHTAGNSSGIVDGAAAVLIASREKGESMGLRPRAKIRSVGLAGAEPVLMLTGPMPASRKALSKAGMNVDDIDLFEGNEAFATVPMVFMENMGVGEDRINVHGGSIALGHPLGATGAMLLGTLLDALEQADKSTGLVTLCVGGGMGIATIIERV